MKHRKIIGWVVAIFGLIVALYGAMTEFYNSFVPNWRIPLGIAILFIGFAICKYGRWLTATALVALLAFPALSLADGNTGSTVFNNGDTAYATGPKAVGLNLVEFTTDLQVAYHWNYKQHKVWIDGWDIAPAVTSFGGVAGWHIDQQRKMAQSCFKIYALKSARQGCAIKVMVHWDAAHCPLHTCGSSSVYRYMRTFVYFDGDVQQDDTGSPVDTPPTGNPFPPT